MREAIEDVIVKLNRKRVHTLAVEELLIKRLQKQYEEQGGYKQFASIMKQLVDEKYLKPVQAQGMNAYIPQLYNMYSITREGTAANEKQRREILNSFHPRMNMNSYVQDVHKFEKDKPYLLAIHHFLKDIESSCYRVSVNERSFQLFKDEKWLHSKDGQALLRNLHLSTDDLHCYFTHEPFFYFYKKQLNHKHIHILVVENKDTFFSLKMLLQENIFQWNSIPIELLIYGEGKKIVKSISFLEEVEEIRDYSRNIHYFGDIDPEGIAIYSSLATSWTEPIYPFTYFYKKLIEKYSLHEVPIRKKIQNEKGYEAFSQFFDISTVNQIEAILALGRYIPQEGLSKKDFYELADERS